MQIEVEARHRGAAVRALTGAVGATYGIEPRIDSLPPGGLVPADLLTALPDVMKPRSLFGADEDWDKALRYY
jgi:phenylacetate-CoA ligase